MSIAVNFLKDIKADIKIIAEDKKISDEIRNNLVQSVAFRALGAIIAMSTAFQALLPGLPLLISGGALAPLYFISSIALGTVIAHELIRVGCNLAKEAKQKMTPPPGLRAMEAVADVAKAVGSGVAKGMRRVLRLPTPATAPVPNDTTPSSIKNTWVLAPVYNHYASIGRALVPARAPAVPAA